MLNLWGPTQATNGDWIVDVTAEQDLVPIRFNENWLVAALELLGTPLPVSRWSCSVFRTRYYSSYGDGDAITDRWPRCWSLRVHTGAAADVNVPPRRLHPVPCAIMPEMEVQQADWDRTDAAIAIVADVPEAQSIDEERTRIRQLLRTANIAIADDEQFMIALGHQLRIVTEPLSIDSHASQLEHSLRELESNAVGVRWHTRQTWEPPVPQPALPGQVPAYEALLAHWKKIKKV